jgi:hypothetical protein
VAHEEQVSLDSAALDALQVSETDRVYTVTLNPEATDHGGKSTVYSRAVAAGSGATMSKLAPEDQSLLWQAASGCDDVQAACAARAAHLSLVAPAAGRAYCVRTAFCRAAGDA